MDELENSYSAAPRVLELARDAAFDFLSGRVPALQVDGEDPPAQITLW
jgi:hypothetical protein